MFICVVCSMSVLCVFMGVAQHPNRRMVEIYHSQTLFSRNWHRCPDGLPAVALAVPCPVLCLAQVA